MTKPPIKSFGKYTDLLVAIIAIIVIPKISTLLTHAVYPSIAEVDPDEVFLYISIHHLIQLGLTIFLMLLFYARSLKEWGFNLHNWKISLQWITLFMLIYGAIKYLNISGNANIELPYPNTEKNKIGYQFFQYGLSGLGEEPLFRGFVMTFLATQWTKIYRPFGIEFPITIIIATFLFMLAHIDFFNFNFSAINWDQQLMSLQLGLIYGLVFHQTKSLLAPIIIHGFSNGIPYSLMHFFL